MSGDERRTGADNALDMNRVDALFRSVHLDLKRFAARNARGLAEPEDIVQETFARALRAGNPAFLERPGYLFLTAKNLIVDLVRREKSRGDGTTRDVTAIEEVLADDADVNPHDALAIKQEVELIEDGLRRLNGHCHDIFLMNRVEGLTYEQIGERLGITRREVHSAMSKSLIMIRRTLEDARREPPRAGKRHSE